MSDSGFYASSTLSNKINDRPVLRESFLPSGDRGGLIAPAFGNIRATVTALHSLSYYFCSLYCASDFKKGF